MLPSFLLALREGLEAALIIGIVLGALQKMQRPDLNRYVWLGAASAVLLSVLAAVILFSVGASLEGAAEEIFEGITMLLAAGVLTWMIFWMQAHARTIKSELESGVRRATLRGGSQALFLLAFLAVLREGIELSLFLTAATFSTSARLTLAGGLLGLAFAALLGWLVFATTVRLNLRRFFQVTSALLILFAAGLVAHGVHELVEVGWVPALIDPLWDINPVLDEGSPAGQILSALFGYNGDPSLTEVLAYFAYFAAIAVALSRRRVLPPAFNEA
ncbi:MAG TPA: FTR1 family protein [Anaerolineales bacterium]|nr:FTR1 family protein [Anaerolineales bacterium]